MKYHAINVTTALYHTIADAISIMSLYHTTPNATTTASPYHATSIQFPCH
jgi:hypothetical protein